MVRTPFLILHAENDKSCHVKGSKTLHEVAPIEDKQIITFSEGEHNIDLTYVTTKIIATSFPSEGFMSCYRNNIIDVARFLDEKHGIEKFGEHRFRVYNLCSEMSYDETIFHDQVRRVCIPDHNVPTVAQMIAFVEEANKWLEENEDNVVVIHCKGGKGRTGRKG